MKHISCSNVVQIHLFHITQFPTKALLPISMENTPVVPGLRSLSGIHKPIIIMISVPGQSIRLKVLPSLLFIRKDLVVLYLPH